MPGVLAVYHAGGDDLGLAPFQSFPMLSEASTGRSSPATGSASSATSWPRSWPRQAPQAVDAAEAVVVDVDPLPGSSPAGGALGAGCPAAFPRSGSNVCFATSFGDDEDPLVGPTS